MKYSSALVAAAAFGLTSAHWDTDAESYSTPENTDTKCNSQQQNGYTFGGVPEGPMSHYGGLKFGGYDCKTTNYKRTFSEYDTDSPTEGYGKCISGAAAPESGPSMEAPDNDFSIGKMHLSTEFDTPIDCHYEMPNGDSCKETHDCSSKGTTIENTQCGGAKKMSIALPKEHKSKSCHVSVHSIGFHCGPGSVSSYPAPTPTPSSYNTPVAPAYTPPSKPQTPGGYEAPSKPAYSPSLPAKPSTPAGYGPPAKETPAPYNTPAPTPSGPAGYTPPKGYSTAQPENKPSVYTTTTSCTRGQVITSKATEDITSTITSVETHTITSCAPTVTDCPVEKKTVTKPTEYKSGEDITSTVTQDTVITNTVTRTRAPKAYPSANAPEQPSSPNSPTNVPEAPKPYKPKGTTCPPGYKVTPKHANPYVLNQPKISGDQPAPMGGTSPSAPAPAPKTLPRCLNSFKAADCQGNTDAECYCKNSEYVTNVINCAVAHGKTKEEAGRAINYLQGICVKDIENNPALITAVPSTVTVQPVAKNTAAPEYTTVPVSKALPTTTIHTTLTVPKVVFNTKAGKVGLNYVAPTHAPAAPPAYPAAPAAPGAPGAPAPPAGTPAQRTAAPTEKAPGKAPKYTGAANKNAIGGGMGAAAGIAALFML